MSWGHRSRHWSWNRRVDVAEIGATVGLASSHRRSLGGLSWGQSEQKAFWVALAVISGCCSSRASP